MSAGNCSDTTPRVIEIASVIDFTGTEGTAMCNGKHYWNLLFYGNGNVTFANNWMHDFTGRAPRAAYGEQLMHLVDNVFENGAWHALNTGETSVRVLAEGNTFDHVQVPVLPDSTPGNVFALREQTQASISLCTAAIGRACAINTVTPAQGFTSDSTVLTTAATLRAGLVKPGTDAPRGPARRSPRRPAPLTPKAQRLR